MSLRPKKFGVFDITSVPRAPTVVGGKEVFRGHGSDTTDLTDNILYIMLVPLERTVVFKAFLDSFSINLTKEVDKLEEADKDASLIREYSGQVTYDITINVPAHSVNEAKNNVAKLEELQKLIAPLNDNLTDGIPDNILADSQTTLPIFKVFLKNLISNGDNDRFAINTRNMSSENLQSVGLPCYIETITYEPDVEAGYFEFDSGAKNDGLYLYPKNIVLKLTLGMDQNTLIADDKVILPFAEDGNYDFEDRGGFPFGVKVVADSALKDPFTIEEENGAQLVARFSNKTINTLDYSGSREDSYIYISNGVVGDENPLYAFPGAQKKRWVIFKPFIDSFSRSLRTDLVKNESKTLDINGGLMAGNQATFGELKYDLQISLPAMNVEEAKKNCGKLSYLARMFFRRVNDDTISQVIKSDPSDDKYGESKVDFEEHVPNSDKNVNLHKVLVYIPSMIESPRSTYSKPPNTNHVKMEKNALPLYFENLELGVNLDQGFFEEDGMLYPKELTMTMAFYHNEGDLIKNYNFDDTVGDNGAYSHRPSATYPGKEHFFPFNRKTIKLGE